MPTVTVMHRSYMIYCMLLCNVQLINSYICRPLDFLVAETALQKLRRHGWFLQEAVVPFPRFSDLLATDEREQLAEKPSVQLSATLPAATAAVAHLPRYDARDKTFRPYR